MAAWVLKVNLNGDVRRLTAELPPQPAQAFAAIVARVQSGFNLPSGILDKALKYKDCEGDLCTLHPTTLPDFLQLSGTRPLRIHVGLAPAGPQGYGYASTSSLPSASGPPEPSFMENSHAHSAEKDANAQVAQQETESQRMECHEIRQPHDTALAIDGDLTPLDAEQTWETVDDLAQLEAEQQRELPNITHSEARQQEIDDLTPLEAEPQQEMDNPTQLEVEPPKVIGALAQLEAERQQDADDVARMEVEWQKDIAHLAQMEARRQREIDDLALATDLDLAQRDAELQLEQRLKNMALDDLAIATAMAAAEAAEMGLVADSFRCPCCYEQVPPMEGLFMSPTKDGCNHAMCRLCFTRLISGQIEKKELCLCPLCPAASTSSIPTWLIRRELGEVAAADLVGIEQIHLNQVGSGDMRLWQCPVPDCPNRLCVRGDWDPSHINDAARVIHCDSCNKWICVRCNVEEHLGYSCEQYDSWRKANDSVEQAFAEMLRDGLIKPCPNCSAPIQKTEGCNFMSCEVCKSPNKMCWETGKARYGTDNCGGGHNCH